MYTRLHLTCCNINNFFYVKNFQLEEKLLYDFTHAKNFTTLKIFVHKKAVESTADSGIYQ